MLTRPCEQNCRFSLPPAKARFPSLAPSCCVATTDASRPLIGLLQEYHHLRDRHDSLLARSTSTGGINSNTSSPKRKSRLSTSSTSATPILPTPTSCAMPKRRSWRTSLGFPPPSGILSSVLPHRRSSNGLSLRRKSGDQNVDPSTPTSPDHSRKSTNAQTTPDTSPIATRHRYASTSSIGSINGPPPPSQLFSPGASGGEVATLGQANYTLTLQLNELEAESERSEREGRKKLRKLERELQAMRDDLERVEQRNAMLEGEAKAVTDLAKSVRISPSHEREETPESTTVSSDQDSTPRYGADDLDWRARMKEELGSDLDGGTSAEHSPVRSFAPSANEDPFSHSTISDFTSSFLSPRRTPGRGFSTYPFTGSRSVSASSLLPLPEPYEFDTTMEEQQDLLVEQLMAKIDELQDANEAIVLEREEMVCRLEEAQEEVEGWKERCEDLEEETVQGRLVGWGRSLLSLPSFYDEIDFLLLRSQTELAPPLAGGRTTPATPTRTAPLASSSSLVKALVARPCAPPAAVPSPTSPATLPLPLPTSPTREETMTRRPFRARRSRTSAAFTANSMVSYRRARPRRTSTTTSTLPIPRLCP